MAKQIYKSCIVVVILVILITGMSRADDGTNNKAFLPVILREDNMTQISRPQQGRQVTYPDAGGYTANQWARIFRVLSTDPTAEGPFFSHLNGLEVTNPAGVTIRVDSGMGLVNGHFLINEALTPPAATSNVDFTPSTPAASRDDIVVMVHNGTDIAYDGTPDYGGTVLEFPTDLTDYAGLNSVPPHSARLAILTGVDGGAARALTQDGGVDGDIWMVQLATYTISNVPAISVLTDVRDFVDAETTSIMIPIETGYNDTGASEILLDYSTAAIILPDAALASAYSGRIIMPWNYIKDATVEVVVIPVGSANVYLYTNVAYGLCGEAQDRYIDDEGFTAIAVADSVYNCIQSVSLTNVTPEHIIKAYTFRDATDPLDTLSNALYVTGWKLTYFGWKR